MEPIFLLYPDESPLYFANGAMALPLARCVLVRRTAKAWLLGNLVNAEEAWFPESCFKYHWHPTSATVMQAVVTVPAWLREKKTAFFTKEK